MSGPAASVRWAGLRPDDFRARRDAVPIAYLPLGLCEPHGRVAALGLDLTKAEYLCEEAARRFGGIVAPSQGYHIHECGFHAPWLAEVVGEDNPLLTALPPHVMLHLFLYQLRAFANAGFKVVIAVSGHSGGSQEDLRRAAALFARRSGRQVIVKSDPEWVEGLFAGDHAGKYELSQLMAIRPELVDLSLIGRDEPGRSGRFALGPDAAEASAEHGRVINEAIIGAIGRQAVESMAKTSDRAQPIPLHYAEIEELWAELAATLSEWRSVSLHPGQPPAPAGSRWSSYVDVRNVLTAK